MLYYGSQNKKTFLSCLVNKANWVHNLFLVYLSVSTCFERLCAHHQEKKLCLCDTGTCYSVCYAGWNKRHSHRITSNKCRIKTVVSPDGRHIFARNMQRLINILRINILGINCAPSWLYLQDHSGMYGQKNKNSFILSLVVQIRTLFYGVIVVPYRAWR